MLEKEVQECYWDIFNVLRGPIDSSEIVAVMAAYILYQSYEVTESESMSIDEFVAKIHLQDDHIKYFIKDWCHDFLDGETWIALLNLTKKYSQECFRQVVLMRNDNIVERMGKSAGEFHTPVSIEKLGIKLLEIEPGNCIADLCCGVGNTTLSLSKMAPKTNVVGVEVNSQACAIARIRSMLSGSNIEIIQNNVFSMASHGKRFDRIFMDHPFGMRIQMMGAGKDYYENKNIKNKVGASFRSGDWLFNILLMELLSNDGKAVTIMTNGSTWNLEDCAIRKWFVENKYIESVIALPPALYFSTSIPTTMIVFNRNIANRKGIYMVDATECCVKGRRKNELADENIEIIISAIKEKNSPIGRLVSNEEIAQNNFVLNPSRFLAEKVVVQNGVPFKTVINNITRGANIRATELDKMTSKSPTAYQYMMLGNIQNGIITENLPFLIDIEENLRKYCIKNHSLLISKNGEPYKIAIAEVEEGKTILANGNLYVIELDEGKVNPYYLKAFFESDKGKAQLHSITVGAVMPCIGVKDLKDLIIPLPTMKEQQKIAERYLYLQDEIKLLYLKLDKTIAKLGHVFSEEEE